MRPGRTWLGPATAARRALGSAAMAKVGHIVRAKQCYASGRCRHGTTGLPQVRRVANKGMASSRAATYCLFSGKEKVERFSHVAPERVVATRVPLCAPGSAQTPWNALRHFTRFSHPAPSAILFAQ